MSRRVAYLRSRTPVRVPDWNLLPSEIAWPRPPPLQGEPGRTSRMRVSANTRRLRKALQIDTYSTLDGHVAEWLRNGLQNRVPRFNSGRGLQTILTA